MLKTQRKTFQKLSLISVLSLMFLGVSAALFTFSGNTITPIATTNATSATNQSNLINATNATNATSATGSQPLLIVQNPDSKQTPKADEKPAQEAIPAELTPVTLNKLVPALPSKATFYPDAVKIEASQELTPMQGANGSFLEFTLPPKTELNTLRIEADAIDLSSWTFRYIKLDQLYKDTELYKELKKTEEQLVKAKAKHQAINTKLALWGAVTGDWTLQMIAQKKDLSQRDIEHANQLAIERNVGQLSKQNWSFDELEKLENAIGTKIPQLIIEAANLIDEIEGLIKDIKDIKSKIANKVDTKESSFIITVALKKQSSAPVKVKLTYLSRAAGWEPYYSLDALPGLAQIKFNNQAKIWQKTGQDWSLVESVLSSQSSRQAVVPNALNPWVVKEKIIEPKPVPRMMASKVVAAAPPQDSDYSSDSLDDDSKAMAPAMEKNEASFEQKSTFSIQNIGKINLSSGSQITHTVKAENLAAEFYYTVRPSNSKLAFLTAKLKEDALPVLSTGAADFLVDGAFIGSNLFANATDKKIFFGTDPLVNSDTTLTARRSGLEANTKTRVESWAWNMELSNEHDYPIKIRVEDSKPIVEPASYKVSIKSEPTALLEKETLVWSVELQAKAKANIKHEVIMTGPEKVQVIPGR